MIPYDLKTSWYEQGPQTALTPKIVAHGSQSNIRVLKANPVGYVEHPDGSFHPYASARMEHAHQPIEHAMLQDNEINVDHYRLGQLVPARGGPHVGREIRPDVMSIFEWPDTSITSPIEAHPIFGGASHPGQVFGPGKAYTPRGGQG